MNLGLKDDGQKPNLALCDPYALVMWGSVMTHGASKYGVMPRRFDDRYREVPDGTGAQL